MNLEVEVDEAQIRAVEKAASILKDDANRRTMLQQHPRINLMTTQLQDKLQSLDAARETVAHPHEIWFDEGNPKNRRAYVRITVDPTGRRVVNAVDEGFDHVLSWHTNDRSFDHYRKGKLLWIRG